MTDGVPTSAPLPVVGFIDQPDGRAPVARGPIVVRGWALGTSSPVSKVEIRLDGRSLGCAGLGRLRADVAATLQNDEAELSGFEFRFDIGRTDQSGDRIVLGASVTLLDDTRAELTPVEIPVVTAVAPFASSAVDNSVRARFEPIRWRLRPKRVRLLCFARSLDHGGSQLRMRELMQHLQATAGFESTVVAPADGPLRHDLEAAGVVVKVAPIRLDDITAYEEQLAQVATWAAGNFDVVLAFTLTSFAGIDLAGRLGLPSVWRIGESQPVATVVDWLGGVLDPAVELRSNSAYDMAAAVVFISAGPLRARQLVGSPGRFIVADNGVDAAAATAYTRASDRDACRQALGLSLDQRILICAATLWPVKGQHLLVSAMQHIRQAHPQLACVLIGQSFGPYAEALSRFISRHRLAGCLRIVPFCDDLRPWWRAADAAVLPSESEAISTSALEAMSHGLPVLASRVDGMPDVVKDGLTGWLCEPNDVRSLIDGLDRVATAKHEELRLLGDAATRLVDAAHDRAEALSRMTTLLKRVSRMSRPRWFDWRAKTRRQGSVA